MREPIPIGPFYAAAGVDPVDWYKVNMAADRPLKNALLTKVTSKGNPYFEAYDKDFKLLASNYSTASSIDLKEISVGYNGPVYFAVREVDGDGWYKLTFDIPNDPPVFNGGIPVITMDEDTSDNSLVLSDYYTDEEGQTLAYSVVGSSYHCKPTVNRTTGRVTFNPEPNWWGEEKVRFQAKDDGPRNLSTECNTTIVVRSVNDRPAVTGSITDATINEERTWNSPDLATLFKDIDDVYSNLTVGCRVTNLETFPSNSTLPARYDPTARVYTFGPAHLFYGKFSIELNCTDRPAEAADTRIAFNITVNHVNHDPMVKNGTQEPVIIMVPEDGKNSTIMLGDYFLDPDLPAEYAADELSFTASPMVKFNANISRMGNLIIDSGKEEYTPEATYWEMLTVTAKDLAGKTSKLTFKVYIQAIDDPPAIPVFSPTDQLIIVDEGQTKTFSLTPTDPDTDASRITYKWYLDGVPQNTKGATYAYQPDFSTGDKNLKIKVEVSDGTTTTAKEWVVTVKDINRLPTGAIKSPANFTKFKKGAGITFAAEGSDLDNDNLTYIWRNQGGAELGRGLTFTTKNLPVGTQTIKLEISDGKGTTSTSVDVIIANADPPAKSPGFESAVFAVALGVCLLLAAFRRKP